jgi:uncharacterized protein (DUF433 family)
MTDLDGRIEINPKIMGGKPVVRGTRITVEHVMRELAAGRTQQELTELYPRLTVEDIRAACAYAATQLADERISFVAA